MTSPAWAVLSAAAGAGELAALCFGGFGLFRRVGATVAESVAYAVITAMMALSFLYQVSFILGAPWLSVPAEIALSLFSVFIAWRCRAGIRGAWRTTMTFIRSHPAAALALTLVLGYMTVEALVLPPEPLYWEELGRVLLFQHNGSFFRPLAAGWDQGLSPVNLSILSHLFLRRHADWGAGLPGLLAYLAIGCATYALARRYAWPPTAITVVMIVASMPRLVYLCSNPGTEILGAAVGLFVILAVYRAVENPNIMDFLLLILGIAFLISGPVLSLAFPAILLGLSGVRLIRRHGWLTWRTLIVKRRNICLAVLPALFIFSQVWLFAANVRAGHPWSGRAADAAPLNADGIQGAAGNIFRYLLESAHFTAPADRLCQYVAGFSLTGALNGLYAAVGPSIRNAGAAAPFAVSWRPDAAAAWFGPLAFLLILPAAGFSLFRGHRRLKAIALALFGYAFIVCLVLAWRPGNAAFFSLFFVCGGFCAAFILPPWRLTRRAKTRLQWFCILLIAYGCLADGARPVLGFGALLRGASAAASGAARPAAVLKDAWTRSVWHKSRWGRDRLCFAKKRFREERIQAWARQCAGSASVGLVFRDPALIYPFLISSPDLSNVTLIRTAAPVPERLAPPPGVTALFGADVSLTPPALEAHPPAGRKRRFPDAENPTLK